MKFAKFKEILFLKIDDLNIFGLKTVDTPSIIDAFFISILLFTIPSFLKE